MSPDRRRLAKVIDPTSATDDLPELTDPLVVVAFEGWNDAGDAATGAVEHLELIWDAKPLAALRAPSVAEVRRSRRDGAADVGLQG